MATNHPQKNNFAHSGLESFREFYSNKFRSFRAKNNERFSKIICYK